MLDEPIHSNPLTMQLVKTAGVKHLTVVFSNMHPIEPSHQNLFFLKNKLF